MKNNLDKKAKKPLTVEQKINRRSFIAFGSITLLSAAAYSGWRWLYTAPNETRGVTAGAKNPLRQALNTTESAFRNIYSNQQLVKTYPKSRAAKVVRKNGSVGMYFKDFKPEEWKLKLNRSADDIVQITLDEIKKLPKTEIIFDFKCVEGWDQISHWGGVKFSDFMAHFKLDKQAEMQYVAFATPNKQYYVGIDMPSAMHPQTLLAYEVNGRPLPPIHGQPLRLIIPVKYGIKNIKRIGTISFSNTRPPDYWAERGYDYYSGL